MCLSSFPYLLLLYGVLAIDFQYRMGISFIEEEISFVFRLKELTFSIFQLGINYPLISRECQIGIMIHPAIMLFES
jgi:hypothetical protein